MPDQNSAIGWISRPLAVTIGPVTIWSITHQTAPMDRTPVTISP